MVKTGWNNLDLAKPVENDEGSDKVAETIPVDERSEVSVQNSNFDQVVASCFLHEAECSDSARQAAGGNCFSDRSCDLAGDCPDYLVTGGVC